MARIRVGILGAGGMGRTHGQRVAQQRGAEVAAICSRTLASAEALSEELTGGSAMATDDVDWLLAEGKLDALYVCLPPAAHAGEVEMALTLILTVLRKAGDYHAAMRRGDEHWVGSFPDDIDPLERQLTGRSVGIVGLGRIGQRLAELLGPFRCDLRAYDPYLPAKVAKGVGARLCELDELLGESEVVVLAAASNEGTQHLLGAREIRRLRKQALLVNVARAALVDTDALLGRVSKGDLFLACDVFDAEPLPADHPLRWAPNAYLTPHRAGGVMESVHRILTMLIDDIENHLAGRKLAHPLTERMVDALDA